MGDRLFCEKCSRVYRGPSSCCGVPSAQFDVLIHGERLIGNSNSWIRVWERWKNHPRIKDESESAAEWGNFSAPENLNAAIETAFDELDQEPTHD